jgi:hypothetical protein
MKNLKLLVLGSLLAIVLILGLKSTLKAQFFYPELDSPLHPFMLTPFPTPYLIPYWIPQPIPTLLPTPMPCITVQVTPVPPIESFNKPIVNPTEIPTVQALATLIPVMIPTFEARATANPTPIHDLTKNLPNQDVLGVQDIDSK